MSRFPIRRLTKTDALQYRETRLHGLLHDPVAFSGCYDEESHRSEADYAALIGPDDAASAVFGAFDDATGQLVGVVGLAILPAAKFRHKATLWGMYTHPLARGHGVGRQLMQQVIAYARSQPDLERILLVVTASNTVASNWYASLGFKLYGIEENAVKIGETYDDDELRVMEL